jgi:hypothetical protein
MPLINISDLTQASDMLERMDEAKNLHSLYHQHLADLEDQGPKREMGIHASEISKCYRQAVYTMRGEEKRNEPGDVEAKAYWKKVLDQGTYIHKMVQDHFGLMSFQSLGKMGFQKEVPISPFLAHLDFQPIAVKWNLHSSADGVFTFFDRNPQTWEYIPRLRVGLEIKSASSSSFEKMKEPDPAHIEQVHVYMAALDIPMFWIMYFNKDNQNITPSTPPWLVHFDPFLWKKLEDRFASWQEHLRMNTLPEKMPGSHCTFCKYKWTCKPPDRKTFKPRPTAFGRVS